MCVFFVFFFFFSSRRRHTRSLCDWSSDVCSSDLCSSVGLGDAPLPAASTLYCRPLAVVTMSGFLPFSARNLAAARWLDSPRSEERRVGKECRSRWWPEH